MTGARVALAGVLVGLGLAAATGPARADTLVQESTPEVATATPEVVPTTTQTPIPTTAPTALRILQASSEVGPSELARLVRELNASTGSPVILRVPGSATLNVAEADLEQLAKATGRGTLVVVQQGDARSDGAAGILAAFAERRYLQPGADPPSEQEGDLWKTAKALTGCGSKCVAKAETAKAPTQLGLSGSEPTLEADLSSTESLEEALGEPAPDDGGFGPRRLLLLGLVVLALGALAAAMLARGRRSGDEVDPRGDRVPPPPKAQEPRPTHPQVTPKTRPDCPPPPRPSLALPAREGNGRAAEVVSVLDPEGYVELDRCIRRARWAAREAAPAVPGDRVEVEERGGRLWAFPANQSPRRPPAEAPDRRDPEP